MATDVLRHFLVLRVHTFIDNGYDAPGVGVDHGILGKGLLIFLGLKVNVPRFLYLNTFLHYYVLITK
jgi:hypothetical protein